MRLSHEMLKAVNYLLVKEKYWSSACALHKRPWQPGYTFTQHINKLAPIINHWAHTVKVIALNKILQSKQHGSRLTINLSQVFDPEFIEPGLKWLGPIFPWSPAHMMSFLSCRNTRVRFSSLSPHPWSLLPLCPCAKTNPPSSYTCLPIVMLNSPCPHALLSDISAVAVQTGTVCAGKEREEKHSQILQPLLIISRVGKCHVWRWLCSMTAACCRIELCQMWGSFGMYQKVFRLWTVFIWHQVTLPTEVRLSWQCHRSAKGKLFFYFCRLFISKYEAIF